MENIAELANIDFSEELKMQDRHLTGNPRSVIRSISSKSRESCISDNSSYIPPRSISNRYGQGIDFGDSVSSSNDEAINYTISGATLYTIRDSEVEEETYYDHLDMRCSDASNDSGKSGVASRHHDIAHAANNRLGSNETGIVKSEPLPSSTTVDVLDLLLRDIEQSPHTANIKNYLSPLKLDHDKCWSLDAVRLKMLKRDVSPELVVMVLKALRLREHIIEELASKFGFLVSQCNKLADLVVTKRRSSVLQQLRSFDTPLSGDDRSNNQSESVQTIQGDSEALVNQSIRTPNLMFSEHLSIEGLSTPSKDSTIPSFLSKLLSPSHIETSKEKPLEQHLEAFVGAVTALKNELMVCHGEEWRFNEGRRMSLTDSAERVVHTFNRFNQTEKSPITQKDVAIDDLPCNKEGSCLPQSGQHNYTSSSPLSSVRTDVDSIGGETLFDQRVDNNCATTAAEEKHDAWKGLANFGVCNVESSTLQSEERCLTSEWPYESVSFGQSSINRDLGHVSDKLRIGAAAENKTELLRVDKASQSCSRHLDRSTSPLELPSTRRIFTQNPISASSMSVLSPGYSVAPPLNPLYSLSPNTSIHTLKEESGSGVRTAHRVCDSQSFQIHTGNQQTSSTVPYKIPNIVSRDISSVHPEPKIVDMYSRLSGIRENCTQNALLTECNRLTVNSNSRNMMPVMTHSNALLINGLSEVQNRISEAPRMSIDTSKHQKLDVSNFSRNLVSPLQLIKSKHRLLDVVDTPQPSNSVKTISNKHFSASNTMKELVSSSLLRTSPMSCNNTGISGVLKQGSMLQQFQHGKVFRPRQIFFKRGCDANGNRVSNCKSAPLQSPYSCSNLTPCKSYWDFVAAALRC